jgi:hypothetical protein
MDDFRADKPGYEAVRVEMDHFGVFLRDPSRTYEAQALEALRNAFRSRNDGYKHAVKLMREARANRGVSENDEAFEDSLEMMGLSTVRQKVEAIAARIKFLEKEVNEEFAAPVHEEFDPKTTVILPDGTYKKFASEVALGMYLNDPGNEAVREHHEKVSAQMSAE